MNLQELRLALLKQTGRYDLITSAGGDTGIDYYLGKAQRRIEQELDHYPETNLAMAVWEGSVNDRLLFLDDLRADEIHSVTLQKDGEDAYSPAFMPFEEFQQCFLLSADDPEVSPPAYYTIGGASAPTQPTGLAADGPSRILYFSTPIDSADTYYVTMTGRFTHVNLVNNSDENVWSQYYPYLLIDMTRYEIEVSMRNTQGMQDMWIDIQAQLKLVDHNIVGEQNAGLQQMEG